MGLHCLQFHPESLAAWFEGGKSGVTPTSAEIFKTWAEFLKATMEAVGIILGGLFVYAKFLRGYFDGDISLVVSSRRKKMADLEYLAFSVEIQKGNRGSFHIHDLQAIILQPGKVELLKLDVTEYMHSSKSPLELKDAKKPTPGVRLKAGEKTMFSHYCRIVPDEPCQVEIALLGTVESDSNIRQVRASAVALPDD